jgi:hypothetical protein
MAGMSVKSSCQLSALSFRFFALDGAHTTEEVVVLSKAKDLLSLAPTGKQVLRFAQDDNGN